MFSDADVQKTPNAEKAKERLVVEAQKLVLGEESAAKAPAEKQVFATQADAPPCHVCGSIMVRNGACYKCLNCGATSGCS